MSDGYGHGQGQGYNQSNSTGPASPNDRFLKLADSAPTPEQRNLFLQQHYRMLVRGQIDSCQKCGYGRGSHVGFQGKTPAFVSFISQLPLRDTAGLFELESQLEGIGYKMNDVCLLSLASCIPRDMPVEYADRYHAVEYCRGNFQTQMQLASSRVFVLLGLEAASLLFGDQPKNLQDVRGNWTELKTPSGVKQWWFVTDHPSYVAGNKVMQGLLREDFQKLGSLLHYAWAVNMTELYPGTSFEHQFTYEQICDVVANDIKQALLGIPAGERDDEFLRIMLRIFRDKTGLAARAFWDNNMARKCGIDVDKDPGWWVGDRMEKRDKRDGG